MDREQGVPTTGIGAAEEMDSGGQELELGLNIDMCSHRVSDTVTGNLYITYKDSLSLIGYLHLLEPWSQQHRRESNP